MQTEHRQLRESYSKSLEQAEEQYRSAVSSCRITDARQLKLRIEYYRGKLRELASQG